MARSKTDKKRKLDDGETNGQSSKKARQDPPVKSMDMPSEPTRGAVDEMEPPLSGSAQRDDASSIAKESESKAPQKAKKKRLHKRKPAAERQAKPESTIGTDEYLDAIIDMQDELAARPEEAEKEVERRARERKRQKRNGKAEPKEAQQGRKAKNGTIAGSQRVTEREEEPRAAAKDQETALSTIPNGEATSSHTRWALGAPTAGRFLDIDPLFVRGEDGEEYLISANRREVQLLSLDDSLVVRTCSALEGCSVVTLALSPARRHTVYIALTDGSLMTWNWEEDTSAVRPLRAIGEWEALSVVSDSKLHEEQVLYLSQTGRNSTICMDGESLFTTRQKLHSIQVLGDMDFIVAQGPSAIVLATKKPGQGYDAEYDWTELPMSTPTTCFDVRMKMAISASKKDRSRQPGVSLAVGNAEGQIHLYDDISPIFGQKERQTLPPPRILHWHREAVNTVKFSRDGNYLISGGKETVLVLWQLQTGKKQYLPHLTSEIERVVVSPDGDRYAVQMGDNSIMVLSTGELKPVANFAGLQMFDSGIDTVALLHPLDRNQILVTVPASIKDTTARPFLQTFDIRTSRHVTRQALTRNNVTDFNLSPEKTAIMPPDVAHMQISHDGQWLATIDEWMPPASDLDHLAVDEAQLLEERQRRREVYLKFWQWDQVQGLWSLSTRVDAPHARSADSLSWGAGTVLKLVVEPKTNGFATVGEDGCVKIWKPKTKKRHGVIMTDANDRDMMEWTCARTVELPRAEERADSPLDDEPEQYGPESACLAYSDDGSMIAVSLTFYDAADSPLVHFIDAFTGAIAATKAGLVPSPELYALGFLDRYLITVAYKTVHVWDLINDTLEYVYRIPASDEVMLAINRTDNTFAIAVESRVTVYGTADTQPLHKMECESNIAAILAGEGNRGYTLLFDDATIRTLSSTGPTAQRKALPAAPTDLLETESERVADAEISDVLAITAATPQDESDGLLLEDAGEDDRPVVRQEQLASIFDVGPSFAMPPVRDMFEAVVGLFGRKPHARVQSALALTAVA